MLNGEITSWSAKCTVIFFPPKALQENSRSLSLLCFSETFLFSRFSILSNTVWSLQFNTKVKEGTTTCTGRLMYVGVP